MTQSSHNSTIKYWQYLGLLAAGITSAALVWWFLQTPKAIQPLAEGRPETVGSVAVQSSSAAVFDPGQEDQETIIVPTPPATAISGDDQLEIIEEPITGDTSQDAIDQPLTLANSDITVKQQFSTNLPVNPLPLLTNEHLIRKFVRAVNALDDGGLVNQYRPFVAPDKPFATQQMNSETWSIGQSNFERYTRYIELLETLGPDVLFDLYLQYQPILEEAFAELGSDKTDFHTTMKGALTELLTTPEINDPLLLVRPSVMYQYQDKHLEALPASQKMMLRMGPENRRRMQALSRAVLQKLKDLR